MKEEVETNATERLNKSRRTFLKVIIAGLGTLTAFALGIPFIGTIVGKSSTLRKIAMDRVIEVSYLTVGQPQRVNFLWQKEDAYVHETGVQSVWVTEHSPAKATVFSPICPHAGCYYNWDPETHQFQCPCHGSVFSMNGKVLGGPAPRPLDTLPYEIKDGVLYVSWERFKSGTSDKIQIS
jgi:menaquinol-cytochrome c reductase iron-sulfur subunit